MFILRLWKLFYFPIIFVPFGGDDGKGADFD